MSSCPEINPVVFVRFFHEICESLLKASFLGSITTSPFGVAIEFLYQFAEGLEVLGSSREFSGVLGSSQEFSGVAPADRVLRSSQEFSGVLRSSQELRPPTDRRFRLKVPHAVETPPHAVETPAPMNLL